MSLDGVVVERILTEELPALQSLDRENIGCEAVVSDDLVDPVGIHVWLENLDLARLVYQYKAVVEDFKRIQPEGVDDCAMEGQRES